MPESTIARAHDLSSSGTGRVSEEILSRSFGLRHGGRLTREVARGSAILGWNSYLVLDQIR